MITLVMACCVFLCFNYSFSLDKNIYKLGAKEAHFAQCNDAVSFPRKISKRAIVRIQGYVTGKNVTRIREGNLTTWYIVDGPNSLKKIAREHKLNVYSLEELAMHSAVPVFVYGQDDKWYKIEDPSVDFRCFVSKLPFYTKEDEGMLLLCPEDFKPAIVGYDEAQGFAVIGPSTTPDEDE